MVKILDPTTLPITGKLVLPPRHESVDGLKIGVLWNGRPFGAKILPRVIELLKAKHKVDVVDYLGKKYFGNIAPKEFFDKLAASKVDAVLVGVGD